MADLVVGRSEGVSYPNNNLYNHTYGQIIKPMQTETDTHFIEDIIKKIKEAKNDNEIEEILYQVYITTQYNSHVRAEFNNYYNQTR